MPLSPVLDLRHGDALEVLASLGDASLDVVLSDPPYGLDITRLNSGTRWDRDSAGFDPAVWAEVRRVIRPGATVAAFGHSRTVHRLATAMEDGGLTIADTLYWAKSHAGQTGNQKLDEAVRKLGADEELAEGFEGWTTQVKSSVEPIVVARRLEPGQSLASAAAAGGTGGFHTDALRVDAGGEDRSRRPGAWSDDHVLRVQRDGDSKSVPDSRGRTPTNLVLEHEAGCGEDECVSECVAMAVDEGGRQKYRGERASRFFSQIRYSGRAETGGHPTAKPQGISDWQAKLLVRPGDVVLDLFAGGGSLGAAAARAGAARVVAIERESDYCEMIKERFGGTAQSRKAGARENPSSR